MKSRKKPAHRRAASKRKARFLAVDHEPEATVALNWIPDPAAPLDVQEPPPLRNRVRGFTAADAKEIARIVVDTAKDVAGSAGMVPRGSDCYWKPHEGADRG